MIKKGDYIKTPRFCTVRIAEIFNSRGEAERAGWTEPTHYQDPAGEYGILGRSYKLNHMDFVAYKLHYNEC